MAYKQKSLIKNTRHRYLRPGALAHLRDSRTAARSCVKAGKKRILHKENSVHGGPNFHPLMGQADGIKQQKLPGTPKTPQVVDCDNQSRLESLPMDLLVKIMCHLHHDQLKAPFHVSQRIRKAVLTARQWYFDYTTPDKSRIELLRTKTPLPSEHWPFVSKADGKAIPSSTPPTPKAPKHGPRSRHLHPMDMKEIAAVLFQESTLPSRLTAPLRLQRPVYKSLVSNRVLFYEDELCKAVAQNKLC